MSSQPPDQRPANHQVSIPHFLTALLPPCIPSRPWPSILTDPPSEGSLANRRRTRKKRAELSRRKGVRIDVLPDEVLLETFQFYVNGNKYEDRKRGIEAWQPLVHVCRRWRRVVFESTNRLNLRLVCTSKTPARDTLDIWPAFPLLVYDTAPLSKGVDNIVAALERSNRVVEIKLSNVDGSPMENILTTMQTPFPELIDLTLHSDGTVAVLPDSFLGGYAPLLESLWLDRIPIPGLPSLLSQSTNLTRLYLWGIPHSGYFSPEEIVTCIATLRFLDNFVLGFKFPLSFPRRESRRPPSLKRTFLPVLTELSFQGVSEYLEDLVARIDAPQLIWSYLTFFNQIDFETPQLVQFIRRTPNLNALEKARLAFGVDAAEVNLSSLATARDGELNVKILCRKLDWQVSSLEQLCTSFLPFVSMSTDLYIYLRQNSETDWKDNDDDALWLALLHPFAAAKNLYLSKEFTPRILPAFRELVGGRTMEVLPTLQDIFLEELQPVQEAVKPVVASDGSQPSVSVDPVQEAIKTIVTARQLSGHPVTVSLWKRNLEREEYPDP